MAVTPNFSWPVPVATDYVKDGWEAISDLGNAIDTTVAGLPAAANTIASGDFTAQSALNLSNVLSNTYKFYRLYIYGYMTTGTQNLQFRLRENLTDVTSGYYAGGIYGNYLATTGSYQAANNTGFLTINSYSATETSGNVIDIHRPSASIGIIHLMSYHGAAGLGGYLSGARYGMTNFTGLTIYPAAGTINGSYLLLGFK